MGECGKCRWWHHDDGDWGFCQNDTADWQAHLTRPHASFGCIHFEKKEEPAVAQETAEAIDRFLLALNNLRAGMELLTGG